MRAAPYWPGKTPPWYGRFTPAESTRYTIGMRWRMAISWARRIFLIVSGHHEPAPARNPPQTRDHARPRCLPLVLVERDQQADFEPGRALVDQGFDPLARRQLPLLVLAAHLVGPASLLEARFELAVVRGQGL